MHALELELKVYLQFQSSAAKPHAHTQEVAKQWPRAKQTKRFGGILTAELANSRAAQGGEFLTEACKNFRGWIL